MEECLKQYINEAEKEVDSKVCTLRCDFDGKIFRKLIQNMETITGHKTGLPHTLQSATKW